MCCSIFQYSRKYVTDIWQKIVIYGWGLFFIGGYIPKYTGYDPSIDASIDLSFYIGMTAIDLASSANFITPLTPLGDIFDIGSVPMDDTFYNIQFLLNYGMEAMIMGIYTSPGSLADTNIAKYFMSHYQGIPADLPATTLQGAREMGFSSLNDIRQFNGFSPWGMVSNITTDSRVQIMLSQLYSSDASKLESVVGLLSEEPEKMRITSPNFQQIVKNQLLKSMHGDRFFYLSNSTSTTDLQDSNEMVSSFQYLVLNNTEMSSVPPNTYGVNDINFLKLNQIWSYSDSNVNYQNVSCKFSVSWVASSDTLTLEYCISYSSGYFGIGLGDPNTKLDLWLVDVQSDGVDVHDYYFENTIPYPDTDLGGKNNLKWQVLDPTPRCTTRVKILRLFQTDDRYDIPITRDHDSNYTTFFWTYSTPSVFLNVFTPSDSGFSKGYFINPPQDYRNADTYPIRWSIYLIFYHGALSFIAVFLIYPLSLFVELFWSDYSGSYYFRNWLELVGTIVMCYAALLAYVGSDGTTWYPHSIISTISIFIFLVCSAYGYLRRNYWPSRGKRVKTAMRNQWILSGTAFSLAIVSLFLGIGHAKDISFGLVVLYPIAGAWIIIVLIGFISGLRIKKVDDFEKNSFYAMFRNKLLSNFFEERMVPSYNQSQILGHVERGSCLVIYKNKIYDIRSIYEIHPANVEALAATVGTDITRLLDGTFGMLVKPTIEKKFPTIPSILERLIKSQKGTKLSKSKSGPDEATDKATEQDYIEKFIQEVRERVFIKLRHKHSSVTLRQLESVYVGTVIPKSEPNEVEGQKQLALNSPIWIPMNFPKIEDIRFPALNQDIKKVAIYIDRNQEFEYNMQTEQSAHRFRFAFENASNEVWFLPGDQIELSIPDDYGRPITAMFTPVTCHAEGYIDLYTKLYKNRKFSNLLNILDPGDIVAMRGPIPSKTRLLSPKFSPCGCAQQLILLCAGAGVVLGMQTLDYYLSFCPRNEEGTVLCRIAILCFSRNEQEMMLNEEIEKLKRISGGAVEVFYCFTKSETWNGPKGRICKSLLETTVFKFIIQNMPYDIYFIEDTVGQKKKTGGESTAESKKKYMATASSTSIRSEEVLTQKSTELAEVKDDLSTSFYSGDLNLATISAVVCGPELFTRDAVSSLELMKIPNMDIKIINGDNG